MDIEFSQRFQLEAYPEKRQLIRGYALMALLAVVVGSLGFSAWNRSHHSSDDQIALLRSADTIRYLDEVLTMSARMAAMTANPSWRDRYEDASRRLDEILQQARRADTPTGAALALIRKSNQRLVAKETQSFRLLSQGKASEASALLQDPGYEADKARYAEGLQQLIDELEAQQRFDHQVMLRELGLLGATSFALLCLMGYVLFSNHRLLVRRIELEQALGVVAQRLIGSEPGQLDNEIQAVLRLLAGRSHASQVWLLQERKGPFPRLTNSWFHAVAPGDPADTRSILKALLGCKTDHRSALTLESGPSATWSALGITALEGVALSTTNDQFLLVLIGTASTRLRWNHREAAILQSIGEVLIRAVENRTLQEQLLHQATTDGLTGLLNRRHFTELLQREWSRAVHAPLPTAVLMLDIDRFKAINDRFGHGVGDSVLVHLAHVLRQHLRDIDQVGRIGGEEFAVLLPGTDIDGARDAAERLRSQVEATTIEADGIPVTFTVSIGVTLIDPHDPDANASLHRADQSLYVAKESGRNCVQQCLANPQPSA